MKKLLPFFVLVVITVGLFLFSKKKEKNLYDDMIYFHKNESLYNMYYTNFILENKDGKHFYFRYLFTKDGDREFVFYADNFVFKDSKTYEIRENGKDKILIHYFFADTFSFFNDCSFILKTNDTDLKVDLFAENQKKLYLFNKNGRWLLQDTLHHYLISPHYNVKGKIFIKGKLENVTGVAYLEKSYGLYNQSAII